MKNAYEQWIESFLKLETKRMEDKEPQQRGLFKLNHIQRLVFSKYLELPDGVILRPAGVELKPGKAPIETCHRCGAQAHAGCELICLCPETA